MEITFCFVRAFVFFYELLLSFLEIVFSFSVCLFVCSGCVCWFNLFLGGYSVQHCYNRHLKGPESSFVDVSFAPATWQHSADWPVEVMCFVHVS